MAISTDSTDPTRRRWLAGRKFKTGLGIQSKLLVMLIGVSVVSVIVTGAVGYISGTDSLRSSVYDRLTELRESRAREITAYFTNIADSAAVVTHGATTVNAARDFSAGFAQLGASTLDPERSAALDTYYSSVFAPALKDNTGGEVDPSLFVPDSPAQRYVQSYYTVPAQGDFDAAVAVRSAGDSSAWSAANARYQGFFADLTTRFGFEDSLILDPAGNVVYSAFKGADLGTNVRTGPYSNTELATGFEEAMTSTSIENTVITDFGRYAPSYNKPTAWVLSPIGTDGNIDGVFAVQLPIDEVNDVMTANRGWQDDGLGETGETYLAGPDHLMRSLSRPLVADPDRFAEKVVAAGTPPDVAAREVEVGGSTLLQPVNTFAVDEALSGRTGITTADDYTGTDSVVAYMPLDIADLHWVMVAKLDTNEALAPVDRFARNVALATGAIVLAVCMLSILLARVFTRPLERLARAAREVSAGNLEVEVPVTSTDELGALGAAFNDMSQGLRTKQELLAQQQKENDELMLGLMPPDVAERYRSGENNISDDHRDVSVVYAELVGFDEFTRDVASTRSVAYLNDLVELFDAAAEHNGVERVRSLRGGFLATCGLVVPRVDHVARMVRFAIELDTIVRRFDAQHDAHLAVRVGIDSGPVTSGLIGQKSMVYDLWGDALDLAHRVHSATGRPGIFVSARVHDELAGHYAFTDVGTVESGGETEQVWALNVEESRV